MGALAARNPGRAEGKRLGYAACGLAGIILAAEAAVPWLNHALQLGAANQGAFERAAAIFGNSAEVRGEEWRMAWRVFASAPASGIGIGNLAGAIFELGPSPKMTRAGEVLTSAHNLPLQLLAETGALGAFLALAGLCTWCWQAGRRYFAVPQPAMWWIIAAVGIELIHSMVEYPLWNAHFLGVTALLMGLGTAPRTFPKKASRLGVAAGIGACALLALALALLLRDYLRLDATRATGTSMTLASAADTARDVAVMRELARGPLAPTAELWTILGAPLDRGELADRLEMSGRVARFFPSNAVVVRRAVFLAYDGQASEARSLLARALHSFPQRCKQTNSILRQARDADPDAIDPLLRLAKGAGVPGCN